MNMQIFFMTVIGMQFIGLLIGKWASRKTIDHQDYFLASKSVSYFPLMMTFVATQAGGGLILGSTDEAYINGWTTLMYPLGVSIGLFLLGVGFGKRIMRHNVATLAQIFESFYGSISLKKAASALSICSLFMVLIAQILASNKLMVAFGISNSALFIFIWGGIILYTTMGGLKAVIATDILQAGFFFFAFYICFFYALTTSEVPLYSTISTPKGSTLWNLDSACSYLLMPLIFMIIGQDMGQRCFAAKSPNTLMASAVSASLVIALLGFVPISFGLWAKGLGVTVPENTSVLLKSIGLLTNPIFAAVLGAAIIAAIVSTADSLISAIGSNLSQDFLPNWHSQLGATKALTGGIAVLALLFSFFFSSIVGVLIQSYELSVCCLTVPILASFSSSRKGHSISAMMAMTLGALGFIFTRIYSVPIPREIFNLLLSILGFGVGELFYIRNRMVTEKTKLTI